MHLLNPEGCQLGPYMRQTRVVIIDDDFFPSNDFEEAIEGEDEKALHEKSFQLLIAYMRFVFTRVPTVRWKTLLTIALDQLDNAYYLGMIFVRVYLVDTVLNLK